VIKPDCSHVEAGVGADAPPSLRHRGRRGTPVAPSRCTLPEVSQRPAIYTSPRSSDVVAQLIARLDQRLDGLDDVAVQRLLEDTVYQERQRFEDESPTEDEAKLLARISRLALDNRRSAWEEACRGCVDAYAREIHNRFSLRAYRMATRLLPGALTRLVTAPNAGRVISRDFDPRARIRIQGHVEQVKRLAERGTVVFTPTHLSNLDSPLIGYALFSSGLPPVAYGAGLNLFSNPVMEFWMSRLGAYTVDRRKQGQLYKEALKGYATELTLRGVHSLFFPGGTRSRSGRVEKRVKKGLLGTAIVAWQELLAQRAPRSDVFVVPMTLSTSLVLEAETLITDSLAREGKSRYIISDDEFSRPRDVASYLSRVLNLDEAVHVTFCQPMDLLGNPVNDDGESLDARGRVVDRRGYVCDRDGRPEADPQRDRVYTDRLARRIVESWHRENVALSTHVASFAAFQMLADRHPHLDVFHLVHLDPQRRLMERGRLLTAIDDLLIALSTLQQQGRIRTSLPTTAQGILDEAVHTFGSYHTRKALRPEGDWIAADMELTLYYRNRLVGYGLGDA